MLKRLSTTFSILLLTILSATLSGNETAKLYFPSTLGSSWVYEDKDGNELTRQVVEGEEKSGVTYYGFSYDPELKDWVDFDQHFMPYLFHVSDEWVSSLVGEEVENALKARLSKEIDSLSELAETVPGVNATISITYDVETEADENIFLLPLGVTPDVEWDSINIKAIISMTMDIKGSPEVQRTQEYPTITLDIQETGIILGTETVDVTAGTFEDCLKIQFQTETELTPSNPNSDLEELGESVTTIWLAPNVGIVKYHQESEKIIVNLITDSDFPEDPRTQPDVTSYELQAYEIVAEEVEDGK